MQRSRNVVLALGSLLAFAGCARTGQQRATPDSMTAAGMGYLDSIDPETGLEASCMFEKRVLHPDGGELIREFLLRDGRGDFLRSDPWFNSATECPGHEPGFDSHALIAGYTLSLRPQNDSLLFGIVEIREIGGVYWDTAGRPGLQLDPRTRIDTIRAGKTQFGWRLLGWVGHQRVLLSSEQARHVREHYADTLSALGFLTP